MSTMMLTVRDSNTMLRRNLRHMLRYPSMTAMLIAQPLVFLLLFTYVFGGTMGAGLMGLSGAVAGGAGAGRGAYLTFITPAILLMTVASVSLSTSVSVASDMAEGIIARFRTMAIARASVLTGHVLSALIQTVLALVVLLAVSLALGYRPRADVPHWLYFAGVVVLLSVALTWLTVALGLVAKNVESASNLPLVLVLLPFLSSGFVPVSSLPVGIRWFAAYQPFTPVTDTMRGLLSGRANGTTALVAVAWCLGITVVGYAWARRLYGRRALD